MNHKAIGHCRVSKGDSEEIKNSLNSQKSQIEKFADRLGIQADEIKWFIESEARSAYSERADWSIFENAIDEACKDKNIKYFIDFSQERFCRNRRRSQRYKDKLRKNNIKLRFVSGDVEDPDSDTGFWQDGIQEMVAEAYSRKVGADTLRGCLENAVTRDPETGYAYKNGGSPPWWLKSKRIVVGQDKSGDDIKKTIWIENDQIVTAIIDGKPVTKTIWEWAKYCFLELRLKKEFSFDETRDFLNELGVPGPRNNLWSSNTLFYCEKNEALYGVGYYNRRQYARGASGKYKDKTEWVEIPNAHPALITKEDFEGLQQLHAKKRIVKGRKGVILSKNYLLLGEPDRFTCKSCGANIVTSGGIYTCGTYNKHGKKGCGAPFFSVNQDWLEKKILNEIKKYCSDKLFNKIYEQVIKHYNQPVDNSAEINKLEKALKIKETEQNNLLESLRNIDATNNAMAVKVIGDELNKISEIIEKIKIELKEYNLSGITGQIPNHGIPYVF